jgi:hypothetical protein
MRTTTVLPADLTLVPAMRLAAGFGAIKLALTFALTLYTQHLGYGYFRDEFYYIACGRYLAWGYVDHGPIVALQARLGEILFGDSLFGIRVLSAFAGALTVFLGGLLTWGLGGRRPAQALAMIGLIACTQYIGVDGFLSMNSYEPVFWSVCILAVLRIERKAASHDATLLKWWMIFGVSAGIGLLNKPSMTFFLIAVALGLVVTPQRRVLFARYAAVGIALMILIALPNVIWQIHNHWPTLEFLRNGRAEGKNAILAPLPFFIAQIVALQPLTALLWITGIVALLRAKSIQQTRWLGLTFLFFYVIMDVAHAKDYYLAPISPAFFAAGAVAWEHRFATRALVRRSATFAFPIYETTLVVGTLVVLPMASPVLRPAAWVSYTKRLHLVHQETETSSTGPLPQFYADRFGWNEQLALVLAAFRSLTPEEQKRVCIFGADYGEAGAINFLGPRQQPDLPLAISGQNSYWTWGTHGCDPNLVIAIIPDSASDIGSKYEDVHFMGQINSPYAMPFERSRKIYLLRDRRPTAPFHWADERSYY